MSEGVVFFDRDGTLIPTANYEKAIDVAPRRPEDLKLFPETAEVVNQLRRNGFLIIIVSNQPDIALGKINETTKESLEKRFEELLRENEINIDAIYYCHDHPDGINPDYPKECDCRKPKTGMVFAAVEKFSIDLKKSWVVGDRDKDINMGKAAGCKTVLIKKLWSKAENCSPDFIVNNLSEVVDIIKKNS